MANPWGVWDVIPGLHLILRNPEILHGPSFYFPLIFPQEGHAVESCGSTFSLRKGKCYQNREHTRILILESVPVQRMVGRKDMAESNIIPMWLE